MRRGYAVPNRTHGDSLAVATYLRVRCPAELLGMSEA